MQCSVLSVCSSASTMLPALVFIFCFCFCVNGQRQGQNSGCSVEIGGYRIEYDERCLTNPGLLGCGAEPGKPACRFCGCAHYPSCPEIGGTPERNPLEANHFIDYLEGDIMLIDMTADEFVSDLICQNQHIRPEFSYGSSYSPQSSRSSPQTLIKDRPGIRWPQAIVHYKISSKFSDDERRSIILAMKTIEKFSCVRFIDSNQTSTTDYLNIIRGYGCYSHIGRMRQSGPQPLSLGYGCLWRGIVIHELLHALGLHHEHSSTDRDEHVNVIPKNIRDDHRTDFRKYTVRDVDHLGEPYNTDSIMQYRSDAFSKDGVLLTVQPRQPEESLFHAAQKYLPTDTDMNKINRLYDCESIANPPLFAFYGPNRI